MFTGSWTVEASDAVGTVDGDLDAIDSLASLLAQSLILVDESDPAEPCFRMLNTIRVFAREQLADSGETEATIVRLTRYMVHVVETVRDALQGPDHYAVSERLDRERDEIRSAVDWALETDDAETVGRLLTPLFTYWWSRGLLPMTHELAEQAAALPSAASLPPYASALLLGARGMSMVMIGRAAEAEPLLRQTAWTDRVRGGHRGRRPPAHPGRPPLRTGRYGGADDLGSLPGLGLPAATGRLGRDRPTGPVTGDQVTSLPG